MPRSRINRGRERRDELRKRAESLAEERAKRSSEDQISVLDARLGEGVGAVKERARLASEIDGRDERARRGSKSKNSDGKVVEGMDTVNAIRAVRTTMRAGHQDVPADDVVIEKAEVLEDA